MFYIVLSLYFSFYQFSTADG